MWQVTQERLATGHAGAATCLVWRLAPAASFPNTAGLDTADADRPVDARSADARPVDN